MKPNFEADGDRERQELLALGCRRSELPAGDRKRLEILLVQDPAFARVWSEDRALDGLLGELPAVPVPTNFTRRVVEEVDRAVGVPAESAGGWRGWWGRWVTGLGWRPVFATVAVLFLVGFGVVRQGVGFGGSGLARAEGLVMARLAVSAGGGVGAGAREVLRDYPTVSRLPEEGVRPDRELLALWR